MGTDCTKCKCWIRPFEPPDGCFACCTAKILRYARPAELTAYFNIDEKLADKLFEISANDTLVLLVDYRQFLTPEEFDIIFYEFEHINEKGWDWIGTVLKQRVESNEYAYA